MFNFEKFKEVCEGYETGAGWHVLNLTRSSDMKEFMRFCFENEITVSPYATKAQFVYWNSQYVEVWGVKISPYFRWRIHNMHEFTTHVLVNKDELMSFLNGD